MSNKERFLFDPATKRDDPLTSYLAEGVVTKSGARKRDMLVVAKTVCQHPGLTSCETAYYAYPGRWKDKEEFVAQYSLMMKVEKFRKRIHDAKVNGYIKTIGMRHCTVRKSTKGCEVYGPL